MSIDTGAFYRVWESIGWTPEQHSRFHTAIFRTQDAGHITGLIAEVVTDSDASTEDKDAVLKVLVEDWQQGRALAALASSATATPLRDAIQERVIRRARKLRMTAYAISKASAGQVSEDHVQAYLAGKKSMGSHKLQYVFRALGLRVVGRRIEGGDFNPTHRITFTPTRGETQVWEVMATPDGPAYTRGEWEASADADWEVVDGKFLFQGRSAPGNGKIAVDKLEW